MSSKRDHNTQVTKTSLQIRVEFKEEFGIDIPEAEEIIKQRRGETERYWHQVLVEHGVI